MKLSELISALDPLEVRGPADCKDVEVSGITCDSRAVAPGRLFVAVRGLRLDGHGFLAQAVEKGAAALVLEEVPSFAVQDKVPVIRVRNARRGLSALAGRFYGHPSRRLGLVGVTGTNGKTTTTHLIKAVLEKAGHKVGLIGTVSYDLGDAVLPAAQTTPEATELQGMLARMLQAGASYGVMEVSSHALALERVADCHFDVAVLTNLTRDHLDFHGDMEEYFRSKLKLFVGLGAGSPKTLPRRALVNRDDPSASQVLAAASAPSWTYGLDGEADIRAEDVEMDFGGVRFSAHTPAGKFAVQSALTGRYNVYNILAAIGVGLSQGVPLLQIQEGIDRTRAIPGRFEKVDEGQDFWVVVDYAHTDDALEGLLRAVRELIRSEKGRRCRVLTVFGCGGDRDRGKRPRMGRAAAALSDYVFLTSDNPRTEDPMAIIREVEEGLREAASSGGPCAQWRVVPDRAQAIAGAVEAAAPGDAVVIAGKGHEDYQIVGERRLPFDDRTAARQALRRRLRG